MLILVADDEPIIRLGLQAMLAEMGHQVILVANGREAIQQARRQPVDLAILDIKMPYTDGLQAAETLSRTNPLPILILTAYSDRDLIDRATDLPIQGYLVKPVKAEELGAAIALAAKRFEETRQIQQQAARLAEQLETRKLIDRAKARLMASGLSEAEAYQLIQRQARDQQQSMRQVALAILKQGD